MRSAIQHDVSQIQTSNCIFSLLKTHHWFPVPFRVNAQLLAVCAEYICCVPSTWAGASHSVWNALQSKASAFPGSCDFNRCPLSPIFPHLVLNYLSFEFQFRQCPLFSRSSHRKGGFSHYPIASCSYLLSLDCELLRANCSCSGVVCNLSLCLPLPLNPHR